ncbi:MAG: cupin domain-containing protein [Anaerolineae bacterium]|nr:MAG: cupin domain-containing protein [Anaerolineae bacterium]
MPVDVINLSKKLSRFADHWSPKIVAQMNDYHIKLAKIQGDFIWHSHAETDELFFVVEGSMVIHFRDEDIHLSSGEMCVVPKGVEHKPSAANECSILLVEPIGTVNTGDAGGELTADTVVWI